MSSITKTLFLIAAIAFQVLVLAGEYISSVYPRYIGKQIIVELIPVDPRSMFRGQYARLNYQFAQLSEDSIDHKEPIYNGQYIYVHLKESGNNIWRMSGASVTIPQDGTIFIRGRAEVPTSQRFPSASPRTVQIRFGIEAFFASPDRALELERGTSRWVPSSNTKEIVQYNKALLMIAPNGKASLVDVLPENSDSED